MDHGVIMISHEFEAGHTAEVNPPVKLEERKKLAGVATLPERKISGVPGYTVEKVIESCFLTLLSCQS
jgi:hypothetical protein